MLIIIESNTDPALMVGLPDLTPSFGSLALQIGNDKPLI